MRMKSNLIGDYVRTVSKNADTHMLLNVFKDISFALNVGKTAWMLGGIAAR